MDPEAPDQDPLSLADLVDRCMGKESLAAALVEKFIDQVKGDLETLTQLLESEDLDSFCARAHRLKGSAASVCAGPIQVLAEELELVGTEIDSSKAGELLLRLEGMIEDLQGVHGRDRGDSDSDRQYP